MQNTEQDSHNRLTQRRYNLTHHRAFPQNLRTTTGSGSTAGSPSVSLVSPKSSAFKPALSSGASDAANLFRASWHSLPGCWNTRWRRDCLVLDWATRGVRLYDRASIIAGLPVSSATRRYTDAGRPPWSPVVARLCKLWHKKGRTFLKRGLVWYLWLQHR